MLPRAILPDLRLQTECACMSPQPCVCAPRFGIKIAKTDRDSCKNMVAGIEPSPSHFASAGACLEAILFQESPTKRPKMDQKRPKNDQKMVRENSGRLVLWLRILETLSPHRAQRRTLV